MLRALARHDGARSKWQTNKALIGDIALLLVDEVHLLNDERGATLEACVARMLTVAANEIFAAKFVASLRFLALSGLFCVAALRCCVCGRAASDDRDASSNDSQREGRRAVAARAAPRRQSASRAAPLQKRAPPDRRARCLATIFGPSRSTPRCCPTTIA